MRVSYPGYFRPVVSGFGFGVVEVVLIARKAIGTITVVAFSAVGGLGVLPLGVFGIVEFVVLLIVGKWTVFGVGCFSFRDDR